MEQIRSFIAIELSPQIREELEALQNRLQSGGRFRARWVKPDGIHLTLKFLGNVAADKIEDISGVIEEAASGIPPFRLEVGELGAFPNLKNVRVVWLGMEGDMEQLTLLQHRVETGLEPIGFPPEKREFKPHLTLARLNDRAGKEERLECGRKIAETEFEPVSMQVESVSLMRSRLERSGAVYSRLHSVNLNAG